MIKKNKVFSIALLITLANIFGKFLGFIKDILISYNYGASSITDAIFLAMSIPTLILGIFTSSTDSIVIPQYNRIRKEYNKKKADDNFTNIINSISIIAIIVSLMILIFPSVLIDIFAPGFNYEQRYYSNIFLRLFSFFGFMHLLYCFFSAYNAIYANVLPRAILSFFTNLLVVIFLIAYPDPRMKMLSIAFFIGNIASAVIPIMYARKLGYKHTFKVFKFNSEFRKFITLFMPIIGVAFLSKLHLFVDKYLASQMGVGSISFINYASRLTSIFDSTVIVGLSILILPILSNTRANMNYIKFNRNATQVIKLLIIFLSPIVGLSMMFSKQIIEIIYMRGEFGNIEVTIVSTIFLLYSPQILGVPLQATLSKIFHSIEDTKSPFYINIISVSLNILLSVTLVRTIGLSGIAIATTISIVISVIMLIRKMQKNIGWDNSVFRFSDLIKITGITIITLIIGKLVYSYSDNMISLFSGVFISILTYIILTYIYMNRDFRYIMGFLRRNKE